MRIGHGFDVHKFASATASKQGFVLAGVDIPFEQCLLAHSDGDVLLHAICDALLGAIGAGDIGQHFPDTDEQYKGISSRTLLKNVANKVAVAGYKLENLDATIICQRPKLMPYIPAMCDNLAQDLGVNRSAVNVKATTTEGLGYEGQGLGISVHAVVLLNVNI